MLRGRVRWGAAVGAAALAIVVPASAGAAVTERAKISLPERGQLAMAKLQFKVRGEKRPELELKAKGTKKLPDTIGAVAQMATSTAKKGRAVALVATANVAGAAGGRDARRATNELTLEVSSAGGGQSISQITFENLPTKSRNFLSVLGGEPQGERDLAQDLFGLPDTQVPADELGRVDLDRAAETMDLDFFDQPKVIVRPRGLEQELEELREQLPGAGIAGAIGPPGAIDAAVYELVFGQPRPTITNSSASPSPNNPSVFFIQVQFDRLVMGGQVVQASDNDLLLTPDARCQGLFGGGEVTRGPGSIAQNLEEVFSLGCDLNQDSPTIFFDIPLERPPDTGIDLFKFMPFPFYGNAQVGEAVAGENVTYLVRG